MNNALLPFIKKSLVLAISAALASGASSVASANSTTITMDGTTGGIPSHSPLSVTTPVGVTTYTIDGHADGIVNGSNLFFSFGQFNLGSTAPSLKADIASFTCLTGTCGSGALTSLSSSITNVISRVTGGGTSDINGTLTSNGFGSTTNFWFFNPS